MKPYRLFQVTIAYMGIYIVVTIIYIHIKVYE